MMFYDVLCLKSILGFLLSKRTSGVSPVIFTTSLRYIFHQLSYSQKNYGKVARCKEIDIDNYQLIAGWLGINEFLVGLQ